MQRWFVANANIIIFYDTANTKDKLRLYVGMRLEKSV